MSHAASDAPPWSTTQILDACSHPLPAEAVKGITCFNSGEYFEAHEWLEIAWRAESGPQRDLYRAILLAAVALYHTRRSNYPGALKVAHRCLRWLNAFPATCSGVQLVRLRLEIEALLKNLQASEPDFTNFRPVSVSPLEYDPSWPVIRQSTSE